MSDDLEFPFPEASPMGITNVERKKNCLAKTCGVLCTPVDFFANTICCFIVKGYKRTAFCISLWISIAIYCLIALILLQLSVENLVTDYYAPDYDVWTSYRTAIRNKKSICQVPIQPSVMPSGTVTTLINSASFYDQYYVRTLIQEGTRISTSSAWCKHEVQFSGDFNAECMSVTWSYHMSLIGFESYEYFEEQVYEDKFTPSTIINLIDNPFKGAIVAYGVKEVCKQYIFYWLCFNREIQASVYENALFHEFAFKYITQWAETQHKLETSTYKTQNIYIDDLLNDTTRKAKLAAIFEIVHQTNPVFAGVNDSYWCVDGGSSYEKALKYIKPPSVEVDTIFKDTVLRKQLCAIVEPYWNAAKWGECNLK